MSNPNRFNPRNKTLSEANTKVILASLKTGPKTMTELMAVSGLTRQTILKKIAQNRDVVRETSTYPRVYTLGNPDDISTIATENVIPDKPRKIDAVKAAIIAQPDVVVFFPKATHHDHSKFHDHILNSEEPNQFMEMYRSVRSKTDLANLEHQIKTMYDLVQFRKTLKEYDE